MQWSSLCWIKMRDILLDSTPATRLRLGEVLPLCPREPSPKPRRYQYGCSSKQPRPPLGGSKIGNEDPQRRTVSALPDCSRDRVAQDASPSLLRFQAGMHPKPCGTLSPRHSGALRASGTVHLKLDQDVPHRNKHSTACFGRKHPTPVLMYAGRVKRCR